LTVRPTSMKVKVRANELLNALKLLHAASNSFGSKYFANYFTLKTNNDVLKLTTSSPTGIAEVTLSLTEPSEPIEVITTTKIFKLLQHIPAAAEVGMEIDESEIKLFVGRSVWHIPRMNVDEIPTPELPEEETIAIIPVEDKWHAFQSFLAAAKPYAEGLGNYQQPAVYFQMSADEGICYCVGATRSEALIDKIPIEVHSDVEMLVPSQLVNTLVHFTPAEMLIFPSAVQFKGNNQQVTVALLDPNLAMDYRSFRRIYEKVTPETIKASFVAERTVLTSTLQRLKAVTEIGGAAKFVGGSVEIKITPYSSDELLLSAYALGGVILAEEVLPVKELSWDEEVPSDTPIRVTSRSLQNALTAFNKSKEVEFAFTYLPEQQMFNIGRATSGSQPLREVFFALLTGGK